MSLLEQASLVITPNAYKESVLYSVVPNTTLGDMTVVRATTATRVNSAGLIESVGVNVPRIDYTNGSCPSLLVEPQRTNLLTYSNDYSNVGYSNLNLTVNNNSTISPDGTNNANKLLINSTGVTGIYKEISVTSGNYYTTSVFIKKAETQYVNLGFIYSAGTYGGVQFDLNSGTIIRTFSATYTNPSSTITNLNNGWFKLTFSCIINTATAYPTILPSNTQWTSGELRQTLTGNNTTGAYFYGFQIEAGSYPTSYIPTVASSVTRNADVISKTGISSLIGTEFTLFLDGYEIIGGNSSRYLVLKGAGGTYANAVLLEANSSNQIVLTILNSSSGTVFGSFSSALTNGQRFKLAVRCKNNDFAYYVNGVLKGSQASGTVPTTSDLYLGYYTDYSDNYNKINSTAIFNTGLTDAECIALTTL